MDAKKLAREALDSFKAKGEGPVAPTGKKALSIVDAAYDPADETEAEEHAEPGAPSEGEEAAAAEMMTAMHAKDTKGMAKAMKNFMTICMAQDEKGE